MPQISFFLPLKLTTKHFAEDGERAARLLLPSIARYVKPELIGEIVVCVASGDYERAVQALSAIRSHVDVRIIDESTLVDDSERAAFDSVRTGWRKQQFVKLLSYRVCRHDHILTLDADVVVNRFLDETTFFRNGRAVFHDAGRKSHPKWWDGSSEALGMGIDLEKNRAFGVTPAPLMRKHLRALAAHLEDKAAAAGDPNWIAYLSRLSKKGHIWSEYTLYWTFVCATAGRDDYVRGKLYKFQFAAKDPETIDKVLDYRVDAPFSVFQSTKHRIADTTRLATEHCTLRSHSAEIDKSYDLGSGYYYVREKDLRFFLSQTNIWQTSIGGVGSNYVARMFKFRFPYYPEVCHFPYPIAIDRPGFRAVYLFDDIYDSLTSQFSRNHQINIRKISNRNYRMKYCNSFNIDSYAALGRDLLGVKEQFRAWMAPRTDLGYPVCRVRFSALADHLAEFCDFLELGRKERWRLRTRFNYRPRENRVADVNPETLTRLRTTYDDLDREIRAAPDFAIG